MKTLSIEGAHFNELLSGDVEVLCFRRPDGFDKEGNQMTAVAPAREVYRFIIPARERNRLAQLLTTDNHDQIHPTPYYAGFAAAGPA